MAIVLKPGKKYTDVFGNVGKDYYGVIDRVDVNKNIKRADISFNIFLDEKSRKQGKAFIEHYLYRVESDYEKYFALPLMMNSNVFKQAYLYLDTLEQWSDWEADE